VRRCDKLSEESAKQRQMQPEKYPTRQEQRNNREKQSTQYLTRFDNLPSPWGKGGEILLIQQSIQINIRGILSWDFRDTIHESSNSYL